MAGKTVKETIHAKGFDISIYTNDFENEYISLTDIARYKSDDPNDVIRNWMRGRETIEYLGLWESLHNPDFKPVEFDGFRGQAGLNAFTMSPTKWIEGVNAIGIVTKSGRYGGTFAHSDIAFEFASWISAEFKLYIIKDYKRLKSDTARLDTGADSYTYASEADFFGFPSLHVQRRSLPKNEVPKFFDIRCSKTVAFGASGAIIKGSLLRLF